jgi:peptidoglycan/xylan/chitin deacetylase (PgdA/CDA1 family)
MSKGPWFQRATLLTAIGFLLLFVLWADPIRWWFAVGLAAAYGVVSVLGVFIARMNYYCVAVCHGKPGKKRIALTFDDGPDEKVTPILLDTLQKHGAHATFFCVGERAVENPTLIRRMAAEGHTLGNHSYAHKWWTNFLTKKPLVTQILRTQQVLEDLSGKSPQYYRSPMGLSNPHLGSALRETELQLIAWDVRPFDRGKSAHALVARIAGEGKKIGSAGDGSIVLLHDGGASAENLINAVTQIMESFQKLGYSFVSLDELLGDSSHGGNRR